MTKFSVYGVFITLIYSFFFNTVAYKDSFIPREKTAIESQIKPLDLKNEEKIVVPLKRTNIRRSPLQNNNNTPLLVSFIFAVVCKIKKIKLSTYNENNFLFKSIATEKFRVLRN